MLKKNWENWSKKLNGLETVLDLWKPAFESAKLGCFVQARGSNPACCTIQIMRKEQDTSSKFNAGFLMVR